MLGHAEALATDAKGPAATGSKNALSSGPLTSAQAQGRQPAKIRCLDESLIDDFGRSRSRKGVQPRVFRKATRLALTLMGGGYGGDLISTSWQVNGRLSFWLSEHFAIEAQGLVVPMQFRLENSATGFTGEDRFVDVGTQRLATMLHGHLVWAPIHTKLRTKNHKVVHGDFVFYGGAGRTFHETAQGASFSAGATFLLFPARWLSIAFDLQDHILGQEVLGSTKMTNNLVASIGLGIWIPFHSRLHERRIARRRQTAAGGRP